MEMVKKIDQLSIRKDKTTYIGIGLQYWGDLPPNNILQFCTPYHRHRNCTLFSSQIQPEILRELVGFDFEHVNTCKSKRVVYLFLGIKQRKDTIFLADLGS